jgi:hypothetical protein
MRAAQGPRPASEPRVGAGQLFLARDGGFLARPSPRCCLGRYTPSVATSAPADKARLVENLRLTFDLHEAGVEMMLQNLRRRFPDAEDAEIEARLSAWLHERPGAELGDAVGEAVEWPRQGR